MAQLPLQARTSRRSAVRPGPDGTAEAGKGATPAPVSRGSDEPDRSPVLILSFAHSGAEHLQQLLARDRSLACTAGSGIIPMCATVLAIWQRVDRRPGRASGLAASSTRTLINAQIVMILARNGASRWCELATSPAEAAESFVELFPQTRVVCVHRSCADVMTTAIRSSPWGSTGLGLGPHSAAFPGNTAASLVAYWADRTEGLLTIEDRHPGSTFRVRYESDVTGGDQTLPGLGEFLGLRPRGTDGGAAPSMRTDFQLSPTIAVSAANTQHQPPADLIPADLKARAARLHDKLGYPRPSWLTE